MARPDPASLEIDLLPLKPLTSSGNSRESGEPKKMQGSYWGALTDLLFKTKTSLLP